MRKILLMAALCMAAVMVMAPAALAQSSSASSSAGAVEGVPQNCEDFASQAAAQDFYDSDTSDPANLDSDDDGEACETFDYGDEPTMMTEEPTEDQYADEDQYDDGGSDTTVSPEAAEEVILPDTGGPNPAAFALPSLALLVAGGIFAARMFRR